jgi:glycosyltransferase involved in cell wall biosynthesis
LKKFTAITQIDQDKAAKLRVLLAGHLPPPMGGIATYYQSLLSSSVSEKVNLRFVQTSTHDRDLARSGRATFANSSAAIKDCCRFFRAVLSHRPQVCHIGTAFGLSFIKHGLCVGIARICGSRVLLHPHCSLSAVYSDRQGWWRWVFRQIIRLADGVVALSNEWTQVTQVVPGCKVYLLQNAINLDPYLGIAKGSQESSRTDGVINILYLGYIGRAKGSFDLLDAAHLLSSEIIDISINLVGGELSPGELDHLRQQLERDDLSKVVSIHPPVIGEEKMAWFRKADIFVYPSYSEGMPMAVMEAMASGLPVVATQVGGLPDLVLEGVNGILVDPVHPDQLAAALLTLASDKMMRRSMGAASLRLAREKFDIEQHVNQLVKIYNTVISGSAVV